jgi:hypothetical protein
MKAGLRVLSGGQVADILGKFGFVRHASSDHRFLERNASYGIIDA